MVSIPDLGSDRPPQRGEGPLIPPGARARIGFWRWLLAGTVGAIVGFVVQLALIFAVASVSTGPQTIEGVFAWLLVAVIAGTVAAGVIVKADTVRLWVGAATSTAMVLGVVGGGLGLAAYVWTHAMRGG